MGLAPTGASEAGARGMGCRSREDGGVRKTWACNCGDPVWHARA